MTDLDIASLAILMLFIVFLVVMMFNATEEEYKVVQIDGMTCIQLDSGLTCNWDEWRGE